LSGQGAVGALAEWADEQTDSAPAAGDGDGGGGGDGALGGAGAASWVVVVAEGETGCWSGEDWSAAAKQQVGRDSAARWMIVELARWARWATRAGPGGGSVPSSSESGPRSAQGSSIKRRQTDVLRAKHVAQCVCLVGHHSAPVYQAHALCGGASVHGILDEHAQLFDRCRGCEVGQRNVALEVGGKDLEVDGGRIVGHVVCGE
jgi:hypothetical protein